MGVFIINGAQIGGHLEGPGGSFIIVINVLKMSNPWPLEMFIVLGVTRGRVCHEMFHIYFFMIQNNLGP